MALRVTFDTNVLDLACRPERFPKDPRQPELQKVHAALVTGSIQGFYSVTMLTIEGIARKDRAEVFASTRTKMQSETPSVINNADLPGEVRAKVGGENIEKIAITLIVDQPARKPLHSEVVARAKAAKELGVRALKAVPRIGAYSIDDPDKEFYLSNGEGDALRAWINKAHEVSAAIQNRGLGFSQVKTLGKKMALSNPEEIWFEALRNAKDVHEERAVERAFAEWADGDAIAAHIAYGIDIFCSADVGNSNATNSVLDPVNRAWLTETYGVRFMTFDDLLTSLP